MEPDQPKTTFEVILLLRDHLKKHILEPKRTKTNTYWLDIRVERLFKNAFWSQSNNRFIEKWHQEVQSSQNTFWKHFLVNKLNGKGSLGGRHLLKPVCSYKIHLKGILEPNQAKTPFEDIFFIFRLTPKGCLGPQLSKNAFSSHIFVLNKYTMWNLDTLCY